MSRERPDGERRRRDLALSCSAVKAPTAAAATAISTSRPSHSLPLGVDAAATGAIQTYRPCMSSSPAIVIMCVTGAATASEMKAVTTSRTVNRMAGRPVVFLAAACTGHYPGVRSRPLSAFSPRISGNTPVRICRFSAFARQCPRCPRPVVDRGDKWCIPPPRADRSSHRASKIPLQGR